MRPDEHTRMQQIAYDFLGIRGIEFINHPESHAHGQLRPCSFDRVTSEKHDFQIRKMIDDPFDNFIGKSRISRRDVPREERPFMAEQPSVTIEIDMISLAQIFDALEKASVAFVFGARRPMSLGPV